MSKISDPSGTGVPFAVREHCRIPRERYYDRGFYELEKQKLWFRTWQMACRLEEIPQPNDYMEYEICGESILVIRQRDGSARAFFNACRHRGTQLAKGCGKFGGGMIVCPYHGWRWKSDGSNVSMYRGEDLPPESREPHDVNLQECKAEIWGGCVWINPDRNAGPLKEALSPVAPMFEELNIERQRVVWWKEVILNSNWKVAQEAFMESLHVMQTHPQLTMGTGEAFVDPADYRTFPNGHSGFANPNTDEDLPDIDIYIEINKMLCEGMDALVLPQDVEVLRRVKSTLKPGDNIRAAVVKGFRDDYAARGIPMEPGVETKKWWWTANEFIFPNFFLLPMYANCMSYRSRPYNDDPEWCRFEMWSLTTPPAGTPEKRIKAAQRLDKEDTQHWSEVPLQDYSNIERQQRGIHSISYEAHRMTQKWEGNITHMHRELDRRLAMP